MQMKFYFLLLLSLFLVYNSSAQERKKIKLVQAEEAVYDRSLGENIQRIIGNAVFEHEGAFLYCDSAHLNNANNSVKAYSRVHINSADTLHLYGDSIYYNGETKVAEVFDNVKLIDNQTVLTTDKLTFDRNSGIAFYLNGGHIVNDDNTLDSRRGYYHTNSKDFFFRTDVVLVNPEYKMHCDTLEYNTQTKISKFKGPTTIVGEETDIYAENGWYNTDTDISEFNENARIRNGDQVLTGDSLYYERTNGFGQAFKNIRVIDTVQNMIVYGQYAVYDKSIGYTLITDNPEAHMIEGNDTLFVHSDTMKVTFDSAQNTKEMYAYYKMKFYRTDMQGMADSLIYSFSDSLMRMHRNPVLWTEGNQLTADSIYVLTGDESVKKMFLYSGAFMIAKDTTGYNQIKGRDMEGFFKDNELVFIKVLGNAETLYWVREEDGSLTGINKSFSSNMNIRIGNRKIRDLTYLSKPNATLFPEGELTPPELLLDNFEWLEHLRPLDRYDIFRWD